MSFGFGVGDVLTVSKVAWKVYQGYKFAPEEFNSISKEALALHIVLKEIEDAHHDHAGTAWVDEINPIQQGCESVLRDLQNVLEKYKSLGKLGSCDHWERMKWAKEDFLQLRRRMVVYTSLLTAFHTTIIASSQIQISRSQGQIVESQAKIESSNTRIESSTARIESKLNRMVAFTHHRRDSVVSLTDSTFSFASVNSKENWKQLLQDMSKQGIKAEHLTEKNRREIAERCQSILGLEATDEPVQIPLVGHSERKRARNKAKLTKSGNENRFKSGGVDENQLVTNDEENELVTNDEENPLVTINDEENQLVINGDLAEWRLENLPGSQLVKRRSSWEVETTCGEPDYEKLGYAEKYEVQVWARDSLGPRHDRPRLSQTPAARRLRLARSGSFLERLQLHVGLQPSSLGRLPPEGCEQCTQPCKHLSGRTFRRHR